MLRGPVMQPIKQEEIFMPGKETLPLVVFIHGMGMNAHTWADPARARILAGTYPLNVPLRGGNRELTTSFQDLKTRGYNVLAWTQSRPSGQIRMAVAELHLLLEKYAMYAEPGIIFVCHSRGGLIARKHLEDGSRPVKGLITLGTPHRGTTMAKWAAFFQPLTSALDTLFTGFRRKDVDSALRRVIGFLGSSGLKELLPGSDFYRNLRDHKHKDSIYISIGGTDPDLLGPLGLPISEFISRLIPGSMLPEELREGYGDGLVSASSSLLTYADEHRDVHLNHVAMLFDNNVRAYIMEKVGEFPI